MFVQCISMIFLIGVVPVRKCLSETPLKLKVVTWNVADNSKMNDGFFDPAIDNVLGFRDTLQPSSIKMADIYAIGLQEQCWECNTYNLHKIGEKFLSRINKKSGDRSYQVVGIEGTRMSVFCQFGCAFGTHGTTALVVITRKGLVTSKFSFHRNDGCSDAIPENDEKGVVAMKLQLKNGKTLCFGTAHLDSANPKTRRNCLKYFFTDAEKKAEWKQSCDAQFLFGDFNTRTGKKRSGKPVGEYVPMTTNLSGLKERDELRGTQPYGRDSSWNSNLLSYINTFQTEKFKEGQVNFMPTYSILPSETKCNGRFPCYKTNRPMSWTDRIIYTNGNLLQYHAIYGEYSDHFPVYADFLLFSKKH